jgi:hypothetical protein
MQRAEVVGEVVGGGKGVGVILTQNPPATGKSILVQNPRRLLLAQAPQVDGKAAGGGEGVRVVIA